MSKWKRSIGEVGFGKPCPVEKNSAGWELYGICGEERVELLYTAKRGEELPDGLFLVGQTRGGFERITRDYVDWLGLTMREFD